MREEMIPVLPCVSLADTLAFYRLLGFEVTYEQHRPYVYGAARRGDLQVHFIGIKGLDPKAAYSTCLAMVPDVEALHATFAAALRQALDRLPVAGIPRISRMRPGQSRFTVVDVAGNSLIFIKHAARVLDAALAHADPTAPRERALALVARIELAVALADDPTRTATLRAELATLPLTDAERHELAPTLERIQALERS